MAMGAGIVLYHSWKDTPGNAARTFVAQLAVGQTDKAYQQLTPALTKGRESYWHTYLAQFKTETEPVLVKEEAVSDAFNTYAAAEKPTRHIYTFRLGNRTYQMHMIIVRQNGAWKIDELYGSDTK
jgi:hypothetical protein